MLGSNLWRVLGLLVMVPHVFGWGDPGHIATCRIAEGFLTEAAAARVQELLPASAEGDFSSVCPWPDTQRYHYPWSKSLHFIDTPDFLCNYTYCRDCHDLSEHQDVCITGAIYNYTMQLKTGSDFRSSYNLTEALMFLAHFIGDIHQSYEFCRFADESIKLACQYAYKNVTAGSTLGDEYFRTRLPIVEKRLAQGGIRLAALLNRILDPSLPTADQSLPACYRMKDVQMGALEAA